MPSMTMLCGLPYSGKSTFLQSINADYVSTDMYIEEYAKEKNLSYNEVFADAYKIAESWMYADIAHYVTNNTSFWWDQTNLSRKSRINKLKFIPANWQKNILVFNTPFDVIVSRIPNRPNKKIPLGILEEMQSSFVFPTKDEGWDNIYQITMEN